MKKLALVMSALSSALLLTACGGGSSSSKPIHSDGSGNELSLEVFELKPYDTGKPKPDSILRFTYVFSDGNRIINQKYIVNKDVKVAVNDADLIILSDTFEGKSRKQDIDVEGNKIIFNIVSDTTKQKERTIKEIQKIDLSGLNRNSYNTKTGIGINTALNLFNKIPSSAKFPKGSMCYITKTTHSFNHFSVNKDEVSDYSSIKSWINSKVNHVVRTENSKVGRTNQYESAIAVYEHDLTKITYNSVVDYKGKIYVADFKRKGTRSENMDPNKGVVDCEMVNKVAADFLQDQIIQYYK